MHPSHESFVELILCNDHLGEKNKDGEAGRKYTRADITEFLDEGRQDELLSICFELWSYGETANVGKLLKAPQVTQQASTASDIAKLQGRERLEARIQRHLPENAVKVAVMDDKFDSMLKGIEGRLEKRVEDVMKKLEKEKHN